MKKSYGTIALLILVLAGSGLFNLKYKVENKERELRSMQHQLQDDQRAIRVLKAEWAYLNRPDNIQELAVKYLGLKPLQPRHIYGGLRALPWRIAGSTINAPLVDYVLTQPEELDLTIRQANLNDSEVVVFDAPVRHPMDAISLLMVSELHGGGGRP